MNKIVNLLRTGEKKWGCEYYPTISARETKLLTY